MSPTFERAFRTTVTNPQVEGGFVLTNNGSDPGGMTFAGISRRFHSRWSGWALIDANVPFTDATLQHMVKAFYFTQFWQVIDGENLPPRLALQVFDFAVNSAPDDAVRALQTALGTVKVDGRMGTKTVTAARQCEQTAVLMKIFAERLNHYTTKVSRAAWEGNGRGWANRVAHMLRVAAE